MKENVTVYWASGGLYNKTSLPGQMIYHLKDRGICFYRTMYDPKEIRRGKIDFYWKVSKDDASIHGMVRCGVAKNPKTFTIDTKGVDGIMTSFKKYMNEENLLLEKMNEAVRYMRRVNIDFMEAGHMPNGRGVAATELFSKVDRVFAGLDYGFPKSDDL